MKIIIMILLAVAALGLILAVLMGLNIIQTTLLNLDGRDFCLLSMACSLFGYRHAHDPSVWGKAGRGSLKRGTARSVGRADPSAHDLVSTM